MLKPMKQLAHLLLLLLLHFTLSEASVSSTEDQNGNNLGDDESPDTEEIAECYRGSDGAWNVRSWALTHHFPKETYVKNIKYYETELTLVRDEEGPSWYLIAGGWQGAYYYETGEPGESRAGAYLYPDFYTAIVGLWLDHVLLQGRVTYLGEVCRSQSTWNLKFEDLTGPLLSYSPPSHFSLGVGPLQKDPFESRAVEVRMSGLTGAHDGLFANRDILSGEVLAFYNGYVINCDSSLRALDRRDFSDEEEHIRNMYNIALDLTEGDNLCIDLPPELGNHVDKYNATLGHKVNHSFEPNSEFVLFSSHPILGTIMSLAALEDISANSEITVNYGYNCTSDPDQPEWFIREWKAFYKEKKEHKNDVEERDEL